MSDAERHVSAPTPSDESLAERKAQEQLVQERRAQERRAEAAKRALAEAAERRAAIDAHARDAAPSPERNGRGGLEPVRYDDWEIDGRAVDF